jgi:hypothetical protein
MKGAAHGCWKSLTRVRRGSAGLYRLLKNSVYQGTTFSRAAISPFVSVISSGLQSARDLLLLNLRESFSSVFRH